jgi:hypothetical protein
MRIIASKWLSPQIIQSKQWSNGQGGGGKVLIGAERYKRTEHHLRENVRDKKGQKILNWISSFFFNFFFFLSLERDTSKKLVDNSYVFCFCPLVNYFLLKARYLTLCLFSLGQGIRLPLIKSLDCLFCARSTEDLEQLFWPHYIQFYGFIYVPLSTMDPFFLSPDSFIFLNINYLN